MTFILHADEVLPSGAAGHGVVVELRPEAAADLLRQTPVVHANAHPRFVIQPVIHHDQALARPILHARAFLHDHLMRPRRRRIHPVEAVFLEEDRTVGQRRRARPLSVRAAARAPRIRRHALVALPVLKIAQLAAVDLIDGLAVRHAVLAAPQPVPALGDEVHAWDLPRRLHRPARHLRRLIDEADDHDIALSHVVQDLAAVELLDLLVSGQPRKPDAVVLLKALPDAVRGKLQIHRRHGYPLARRLRPLLERVELAGRVEPVLPVRRTLRLAGLRVADRQRRPVDKTQGNFHVRARCVDHILLSHVSVVGILLGVEVDPIRENAQICAHGDELLFPRRNGYRRHIRLHRSAVDIKHLVLHPAQRILRQDPLHALDRLRRPPPRPRREQRIRIRR